jgi:DNA gyrase subunit A
MQLKRLTSLEIDILRKELADLAALIEHLNDLLAHPEKILALVKDETNELAEKYGDDRRTDIVADEVEEINIEDLIREEEMVILISKLGYIRRVPVAAYKSQGRGGKGSSSAKLVDDDFINRVFTASTHDVLTFITNEGKAYWLKAHEIPESGKTARGTHLKGLLAFSDDEEVTAVVSMKDPEAEQYLFLSTKKGVVKKVAASEFKNAKTRGIIAIKLDDGDELVNAVLTTGKDELVLVTRKGQALRIAEEDVRAMGRAGRGVTGIKLAEGDELAGAVRVTGDTKMLLVCERGYGKRVDFSEFSPHGRATGGQKIYSVSDKTGEIVGLITLGDKDEAVCVTSQGKSLRVNADAIACQGRGAGGVRVLDIDPPDTVTGLDRVVPDDDE